LRGASTERQYMVYFPERQILYASDTLVVNEDGSLYDPQLMHEVVQAAQREGLQVTTVYAMHQGPTAWTKVVDLVQKAMNPGPARTEQGKAVAKPAARSAVRAGRS